MDHPDPVRSEALSPENAAVALHRDVRGPVPEPFPEKRARAGRDPWALRRRGLRRRAARPAAGRAVRLHRTFAGAREAPAPRGRRTCPRKDRDALQHGDPHRSRGIRPRNLFAHLHQHPPGGEGAVRALRKLHSRAHGSDSAGRRPARVPSAARRRTGFGPGAGRPGLPARAGEADDRGDGAARRAQEPGNAGEGLRRVPGPAARGESRADHGVARRHPRHAAGTKGGADQHSHADRRLRPLRPGGLSQTPPGGRRARPVPPGGPHARDVRQSGADRTVRADAAGSRRQRIADRGHPRRRTERHRRQLPERRAGRSARSGSDPESHPARADRAGGRGTSSRGPASRT